MTDNLFRSITPLLAYALSTTFLSTSVFISGIDGLLVADAIGAIAAAAVATVDSMTVAGFTLAIIFGSNINGPREHQGLARTRFKGRWLDVEDDGADDDMKADDDG